MNARTAKKRKSDKGLTEEERAAIRARVKEQRSDAANGEGAALAAISKMPRPFREMGERIHRVIKGSAPALSPKTWYGLPAYAKDGKVVCYLRMNPKPPYNDRYLTFGFNESANLDDHAMWPVAFALTKLTPAEEGKIAALVKRAVR